MLAPLEPGWLRAERIETIAARPAACLAAVHDFERYPEWQIHVTSVEVLDRDRRGRGLRLALGVGVGGRAVGLTVSCRYPSPNRVLFEQVAGELEAARGSWAFRSMRGGRTRATCTLEVKPGWLRGLVLRGPVLDQVREAVLDHVMGELRRRVEPSTG